MKKSSHLAEAIKMQFEWISIANKKRKLHTSTEKLQAGLFAALHLCIFLSLLGSIFSFIFAQIAILFVQIFATALSIITYALLLEYADKMSNAVELERSQNPLLVASVTLRFFLIFLAFFFSTHYICFLFLLDAIYTVIKCSEEPFFVDATTVWKNVKRLKNVRRNSVICNIVMAIGATLNMIYTFAVKNS